MSQQDRDGVARSSLRSGLAGATSSMILTAVAFFSLDPPRVFDFGALIPIGLALSVSVFLSTRRGGTTWMPLCVVAVLLWFSLSSLWAVGKANTAEESVSLCLILTTAVVIGSRLPLADLALGVTTGGLLVLAVSLVLAVISPSYGLMPPGYEGGSLRGIYIHRNSLGAVLSLAVSAALCVKAESGRTVAAKFSVYLILLLGVLSTQSSTALVSVVVMTVLYVLLRFVQRLPRRARVVGVLASVGVVGLVVSYSFTSPLAFAALNRSDDLTGRTQIWSAVEGLISHRAWIGYGWSGIWPLGSYLSTTVSATVGFLVPEAHNGYLDLLLQVGIVGLAVVALLCLSIFIRGVFLISRTSASIAAWPIVLVGRAALYNFTESRFESPLELFVLCAVVACLIVARKDGPSGAGVFGNWGARSVEPVLDLRV